MGGVTTMTKDRLTDVGRRLKRTREDRGLSQVELARRADVSSSAISKVESGHTVAPSSAFINQMAVALGVPAGTLLGDDAPSVDPAEWRQYVASVLGPNHVDLVEAIVLAAAEKPDKDRDLILRVAGNVVMTFPSTQEPKHR